MKQQGTLVGAPIRVNDDQDTYASAIDNEIKGGRHSVATTTDRDNITAERRSAGMECYVMADGNTYELANDLVTWTLLSGGTTGGSTDPGSGGTSDGVALLSGNFNPWTSLGSRTTQFVDEIELMYKSDLQAFPTRAITYLQGQFSLNSAFVGTTITLGNVPANNRPAAQVQKYMIVENIEIYLTVDTNGDIKLTAKDGFNLPANNAAAPYYIDTFWRPVIGTYTPTTYTATRSSDSDMVRNNCGPGKIGSTVTFTKTYTSTVSQAVADNLAATDPNFITEAQAYINDPANGATCTVVSSPNVTIQNTSAAGASIEYVRLDGNGANSYYFTAIAAGTTDDQAVAAGTYTEVIVKMAASPPIKITVNGVVKTSPYSGAGLFFDNVSTPVIIEVEDL